ncbi:LysR family transcriptional regulator [Pollutimonas bauzanensis]|uniref:DNA-binding transcriptional regulator, LysR family n=1 Tax=Pollutimonas bauzanensis TaxID=658167 RepID=A0A1M5ZJN6_9BURK|nr:LysR family transcriptional regulator [Pollutimonas bauzanensis]SHI24382.1 DNA-binding transcriptional regulator, LysR family [Pollutimonas bauzanensis]
MALRLEIFDLQLFIHIVEVSSLTQGASRSAISPAAASTRIKNMESTVGARLLNRTPQGVTLTSAGRSLLSHARQVIQQMDHLAFDMCDFRGGLRGQVKVLAHTTSLTEFLPQALSGFLAAHQDVEIELQEALSDDVIRAVSSNEVDIGVVSTPVTTGALWARPFGRNRLVVVLPSQSEFVQLPSITFADTLTAPYVGLSAESALNRFMARVATQLGGEYRPRVQVSTFEAMCRMVEANVGIGIAPISSVERYVKSMNIRYIGLADSWAIREHILVTQHLEALPVLVRNLAQHLADYAQTHLPGPVELSYGNP